MAVTFVSTITPWTAASGGTATSGSFTPTAGNQLAVFGQGPGNSNALSYSGTGSFTSLFSGTDAFSEEYGCADNANTSGVSQTITISQTSGVQILGWAFQYSGAAQFSATGVERITPGSGTGAILGTSVTVPTGSILIALCIQYDNANSPSITSPSGTTRGHGTLGAVSYAATEYAGSGSAIQPSFTDSTNGASASYFVLQILLQPAAAGQPYDDADVLAAIFWNEAALPTLHVDSYQNINLDPQIDDPWPHWHEDAQDELVEWVYDSAANPGRTDNPQPDAWIWPHTDDTEEQWELWYVESAANPGFVDVPAPDAWPWDHADDTVDDWESLGTTDSAANPGFVDNPPPDGWVYEDDTEDPWESWADDSAANSGFTDNPPPDAWPWESADDIDEDWTAPDDYQLVDVVVVTNQPPEDPWWWDEDVGDEWESWQDDSAANSGFTDQPPADAWDFAFDDVDDELAADEFALEDFQAEVGQPGGEDGWPWDEGVEDEWWVDDYQLVDNNPALSLEDAWDHFADLDVDDPWEAWQFDAGVGPDNNPVIAPQDEWDWGEAVDDEWVADEASQDEYQPSTELAPEDPWPWFDEAVDDELVVDERPLTEEPPPADAWPWFEEEVDDELQVDELQSVAAVFAQPPEDAWIWFEEDLDDEWAAIADQATPPDFTQAPGPEDPWDFAYDDIDDQWWLEEQPVVADVVPPPAALAPTDVKVQRPSRRNIRFKWGFEPAIEAQTPPTTAPEPKAAPRKAPQPSLLLRKLYERAEIGAISGPKPADVGVAHTVTVPPAGPVADQRVVVPRETSAERRARRLALVAPRRQRLAEIERGLAQARERAELDRQRRAAIRIERLRVVEQGRLRQAAEIERRVTAIAKRFAAVQRKLDTARRQRERLDALHQQLTRAAAEGATHALVARIEEIRQAHRELEQIHRDLSRLDAAVAADLGVPALTAAHREEMDRARRELKRSRNNLVAVHTAVQLLLGIQASDLDSREGE